ncbi:Pre protein translocase subunit Sec66-domain-containing protein [Lipomyces oligophaga]|uniref:Pre protein translocase subunit Sec66-domain-containing protein n=1 Tax=Lipomyces oligophaga TaxID=45792 RepID=UPI0034CD04C3
MGKVSVYTPIAYLVLLVTALAIFSAVYRRRKVQKLVELEPWFGEHIARNVYLTLKTQTNTKVPDKMLKAALLRRAVEDVSRLMSLQENKPALAELNQRGAVGDELWTRYVTAEKIMEVEVQECAMEANTLKPGWAQTLFPSAAEIVQNTRIRERLDKVAKERELLRIKREGLPTDEKDDLLEDKAESGAAKTTPKKKNKAKK